MNDGNFAVILWNVLGKPFNEFFHGRMIVRLGEFVLFRPDGNLDEGQKKKERNEFNKKKKAKKQTKEIPQTCRS